MSGNFLYQGQFMEISPPPPPQKIVPPPLVVSQNALGMMGEPSSHAPVVYH
jgi:hypothetical protein